MEIKNVEFDREIKRFIEAEQEKYETENGIRCNYTPFCFAAKIGNEIVGVISGATFFSEIYIDELIVKDVFRGNGIGTKLISTLEKIYEGQGYNNMNCVTNGFQATGFYKKCGFELEFIRENRSDPRLNKYFYIKYLD